MTQTVLSGPQSATKTPKRHRQGGFVVRFPASTVDRYRVRFERVTVRQKIREHDTAVVRIRSKNMDWFRQLSAGAPVRITYWSSDNRQNMGTFIGYVTHVRLVSDEDGKYVRDVICAAASRDLRMTAQRTYTNKTASEIVSEIGREFRFKVVTKQHGLRRSTVVQSGQTYWEFLNKLAKRCGYVLRVEGTTIFFLPLSDYINANISRAPLISDYLPEVGSRFKVPAVESIDSWVGDTSDDPERLSDQAVFTSISPETGEVWTVSQRTQSAMYRNRGSRSKYDRFMSPGVVAHSRYDAEVLAKGAADNGLMAIEVNMQTAGNTRLIPYRPIEVAIKDRALSGYWLVKEVTHTLTRGDNPRYTCDLTVATDSVSGLKGYRRVQQPSVRNLAPEITSGFSFFEEAESRLVTTRNGYLTGIPVDGNVESRWVHK